MNVWLSQLFFKKITNLSLINDKHVSVQNRNLPEIVYLIR